MRVRRVGSAPPATRGATVPHERDYDSDVDVPFGTLIDFDLPWCPGAVPAARDNDVAMIMTNIGATILDTGGSTYDIIASSAVAALGPRFATLTDLDTPIDIGGGGAGSALCCRALQSATFTLTAHYSFLDSHMREIGVCPFARECGAQLSGVLVVDDHHLAAIQGNLPHPPLLLLGRNSLTVRGLETLHTLTLRAGMNRASPNFVALWTHPQQRRQTLGVSGTHARRVHQGADCSTTIPHDLPPADLTQIPSHLAPHLDFLDCDAAPPTWTAPPPTVHSVGGGGVAPTAHSVGGGAAATDPVPLPGVPRSRAELRERVLKAADSMALTDVERTFFDSFYDDLIDLMWASPTLFGDPSPRGIPLAFEVNDGPPILSGLHRTPKADVVQLLYDEVMRLHSFGFVERVEGGPNGEPPGDGFCVNPIVLALKHADPGNPQLQRAIRFCLDMSEFNKRRLSGYMLTHLPDLADYLQSFANKLLFSNMDMSQAFHQRPVAPHLRKYLGFTIKDPVTYFQTHLLAVHVRHLWPAVHPPGLPTLHGGLAGRADV